MLHRELPSLTAYLQSERLGVNTVVVHAPAATTEAKDFSGAMSGDSLVRCSRVAAARVETLDKG